MSRFIYCIPNPQDGQVFTPDIIQGAGLQYAVHSQWESAITRNNGGPANCNGVWVAAFPPPGSGQQPPFYKPDGQEWKRGPDGKFFVAFDDDGRPGPDDVCRPNIISGHEVKLRDGNLWTIPIARSVVRGATLPRGIILSDDGRTWRFSDLPEYLAICRDAETIFDMLVKGGTVKLDINEAMRICAAALAINYRVGPVEVSMLQLFSESEMWDVMQAICDWQTVTKVGSDQEKKSSASAGSPISDGVAVS